MFPVLVQDHGVSRSFVTARRANYAAPSRLLGDPPTVPTESTNAHLSKNSSTRSINRLGQGPAWQGQEADPEAETVVSNGLLVPFSSTTRRRGQAVERVEGRRRAEQEQAGGASSPRRSNLFVSSCAEEVVTARDVLRPGGMGVLVAPVFTTGT